MGAIVPELRAAPGTWWLLLGVPESGLAPQGKNSWWVSTQTRPHPQCYFLSSEAALRAISKYAWHYATLGFPGGSEVKASACNAGDLGLKPGSGRSPGGENGNPLQYSCLENSMDGRAWWATVHGVAKSQTGLSDFTSLHATLVFTFFFILFCLLQIHYLECCYFRFRK